jgi:prevent-host-death family protein
MRYVSSREFRTEPAAIWALLESGQPVIVTKHGKPFGVLVSTDESNLHQLLLELSRLQAKLAVTQMRAQARKQELDQLSEEDVVNLVKQIKKTPPKRKTSTRKRG